MKCTIHPVEYLQAMVCHPLRESHASLFTHFKETCIWESTVVKGSIPFHEVLSMFHALTHD